MKDTIEIAECKDVLAKWDDNELVWTIEMGGMGPGYEQAIQISAFEILRYMIENPPDWEKCEADEEEWERWCAGRDKVLFADDGPCKDYGLTGAQVGAAGNIATMFMRNGPQNALDMVDKDRKIMVRKTFPQAA